METIDDQGCLPLRRGAVRGRAAPAWVLDCNCTLCRRYGALWAYPHAGQVKVLKMPDADDWR
jgi:hypothetical protein